VPVAAAARRRSRPTIVVSDDEDDEAPVFSNSQPRSVITGNQNKGKGKTVTEQDSDEDDDVITPSHVSVVAALPSRMMRMMTMMKNLSFHH